MEITNLKIDTRDLNRGVLTGVKPVYEYKNGNRTDILSGYKYEIAFCNYAWEKLNFYIAGDQQITYDAQPMDVALDGVRVSIYATRIGHGIKATATAIKPLGKTSS